MAGRQALVKQSGLALPPFAAASDCRTIAIYEYTP
jgi:hypothetical protein